MKIADNYKGKLYFQLGGAYASPEDWRFNVFW